MALWLERRDEDGRLVKRVRFLDGIARLGVETSDMDFTIDEARQLAKVSSHLPLEKRDWALRISFED